MENDVVDLILADHRRFEELLREVRNVEADQEAALSELSAILVAHAEAEEKEVYPTLRRRSDDVGEHEVEHGAEEHDEGHEALLEVLEIGDPDHEDFGEAVEELTKALAHHLDEEERTILNPAREDVSDEVRERLGKAFKEERQRQLDDDCGDIENVRRLVEQSDHVDG
jgi:hemerythrin-like domain-containing protein